MAESATVGELLVRVRADVNDLETGLARAQTGIVSLSTRTVPGLRGMENAFRSLAFSVAGVPGPVGRLSQILLNFGLGGPTATLVLGGLAAIGGALAIMEYRAKKVEEQFKEMAANASAAADRMKPLSEVLSRAFALTSEQQIQHDIALLKFWRDQAAQPVPVQGIFGIIGGETAPKNAERVRLLSDAIGRLNGQLRELRMHGASSDVVFPVLTGFPKTYKPLGELAPDVTNIGKLVNVPTISIAAATASDRFMERWRADVRQKYDEMRLVGESIGQALATGINDVLQGGNFLKGFFRTLLNVAVNVATTLAGRAIGNALFPGVGVAAGALSGGGGGSGFLGKVAAPTGIFDFANFPAPTNPLASARDAQWQAFFRESGLVARKMGYR